MQNGFKSRWHGLILEQQFFLVGLIVLVALMTTIGWWVSHEIKAQVIRQTGVITANYVNSFVAPLVQELGQQEALAAENMAELDRLWKAAALGEEIIALKIWSPEGRILYATDPSTLGLVYPSTKRLARAWQGTGNSEISDLDDEEHGAEAQAAKRLMETYSPVRLAGSQRIIAVAEFYQTVNSLEAALATARARSWLLVGLATLAGIGLLVVIVRPGSQTIARQQSELTEQAKLIAEAAAQNEDLQQRVQRAAVRTTNINERFLRRISAELHDGPAQSLGLALLRLDAVSEQTASCSCGVPTSGETASELSLIQDSVRAAMEEIRHLAAGMSLPELGGLSLVGTITRAVRTHERRTGGPVETKYGSDLGDAPLALKIALYRFVQEALQNGHHHAKGADQHLLVTRDEYHLRVAVSDDGPGFELTTTLSGSESDGHLGLIGMRERVESIGGSFWVDSKPNAGTTIGARLPCHTTFRDDE